MGKCIIALVVKKNGNLRICIDPTPLNKALKREHFQLPTLDDLLPELADSKVLSTLDLRGGFWQVKLDEASSRLTTFTFIWSVSVESLTIWDCSSPGDIPKGSF